MNDVTNWKVPKWPFFLADALLFAFAYFFILRAPQSVHHWEIAAACVAFGSVLSLIPFYLDYRAMGKVIEVNALGAVAEKIQDLQKLAAQISSATNEWMNAQSLAEKTNVGAKQITDNMAVEVREFSEFMKKMNDSEKGTLRLEAEKLRRAEGEWLQVLVRLMDHVFALHAAAVRTGDPKFAEPITSFQNACRGTARRIGLTPFAAEPDEPFNPERHQVTGGKEKPPAGAVVAETVGAGYTFQGKLLRPALVKLREGIPPAKSVEEIISAETLESENAEDQLSLQSPD